VPQKSAIVVHACGFGSKEEICEIAKLRLDLATDCAGAEEESDIIISGGVPYQKGSRLLAHLMGEWLKNHMLNYRSINYAIDGFDSSTDVQNIIRIAQNRQFANLIIISSTWHLWVLKPLYRYWAKKLDYLGQISFRALNDEIDLCYTSKKTVWFYSFYGLLVEMAIEFRLFKPLDKFLSSIFSKRKNGYPVTGCS